MKKRFLLSMPFCVASVFCLSAQAQLSVSELLRIAELKKLPDTSVPSRVQSREISVARDGRVEMIVRFDDESALEAVVANGGEVTERLTRHAALVRVPAADAVNVAASRGVKAASLSALKSRRNMAARKASHVDEVHSGDGLSQAFTGKDVIVGMFDTGVDPNHINFRDTDGNTRVKRVWHYKGESSTPVLYGEGATAVSRFTTDATSESHGTHVLGIMTGSFADPEKPEKDYRGMAPDAEIALGCGEGYDGQILSALKNIAQYAVAEGKPCVMNLSFGDNIGPHDGSDTFSATLNEIVEENDAVLCMAGGNERDLPISFIKTFTETDCELKTLLLGNSDLTGYDSRMQSVGGVQVWSEDATPVEVSLEVISRSNPAKPAYVLELTPEQGAYLVAGKTYMNDIDGYSEMNIISGEKAFTSVYTNSYVGGVCGIDPANGRYCADMNVYLYGTTRSTVMSNFVCLHIKGTPGKKVFVYCDGYYNEFGSKNLAGMEKFTGAGTNSNIASGEHTIAVGSYVSANVADSYYPNGTINAPSYFSSYGETPDGRIMPDICAPGQTIISSRNSHMPTYSGGYPVHYTYTDPATRKIYRWTSSAGTSQASPHMAGVAALWLSANPNLTHMEVKNIAHESAATPVLNADGWGAGMVDAYAGVKLALSLGSVENVFDNLDEKLMVTPCGDNIYEIFAPGETAPDVTLINMTGMCVKKFRADSDTFRVSLGGVEPGVYILAVNGARSQRTVKVTVR